MHALAVARVLHYGGGSDADRGAIEALFVDAYRMLERQPLAQLARAHHQLRDQEDAFEVFER